ncbi:MAG: hypothetical protein AAF385_09010 [Pseudomonadota bacterium]
MNKRILTVVLGLLLSATATAQVNSAQMNQASQAMEALKAVEPIELSEKDVTRFIAAAKELHESEVDMEVFDDDKVPDSESIGNKIRSNAEANAIIRKHGFDADEFAAVSMNVVIAMGASEMKEHQAEIDMAIKQLEAMKGSLPEGQYQMMVDQVMGASAVFASAPKGNVALVEKYKPELEAIGDD